jgi:hypothetical protein
MVASGKYPSICDHLHRILGHPGEEGMQWHREHTIGAKYTKIDAAKPCPLCRACVEGTDQCERRLRAIVAYTEYHRESQAHNSPSMHTHTGDPPRTGDSSSVTS